MSEFMTWLYSYILERGMMSYIDQDEYKAARHKAAALARALSNSLSEADLTLLESYVDAIRDVGQMETAAIFNATISLRKELI